MNSIKKYLITFVAGIVAVFAIIWSKDIFNATEAQMVFHILCDSFFAVGVVIAGIGLLIFASNEGVFDGLAYGVSLFINMFKKDPSRKYRTLYDYKESRKKVDVKLAFMLICGGFFIIVSLIMYLFYRMYQ